MKKWFELQFVHYLRRRGWIVFWLDPEAQVCRNLCWLQCYKDSIRYEEIK